MLVTGAAGFIGSHVAEACARRGWQTVLFDGYVDNYSRDIKQGNVAEMAQSRADAVVHDVNLLDAQRLTGLLAEQRPDVVIHCAALVGVRPSVKHPARYVEHNVTGTVRLLEAMKESGCSKMIFASSSSVYGVDSDVPFMEGDAALRPVSPYAATKRACELFLETYASLYDLDYVALRLFTVYGPRQRPDLAIHKFTASILRGQPITVNGDGTSSRDYTHVEDIVRGIMAATEFVMGKDCVRETVNLGSSEPVLLRDLIAIVENACKREALIDRRPDQPGDVPRTYADVSRAKSLLGYEPTREIREGIEEFVRWWRKRFSAES